MNILSKTEEISRLAADLTPVGDIAVLLDIDEDELRLILADRNNPVTRAYRRARAETSLMLRRQELELARVGSPLAVQMTGAYIREMISSEDL